jgi:hypothetical protein
VNIASTVEEEEGTSPGADTTVDVAHRQYGRAEAAGITVMPPCVPRMAQRGMVAPPMVARMPLHRAVAALTVVVANRTVAANTASW